MERKGLNQLKGMQKICYEKERNGLKKRKGKGGGVVTKEKAEVKGRGRIKLGGRDAGG